MDVKSFVWGYKGIGEETWNCIYHILRYLFGMWASGRPQKRPPESGGKEKTLWFITTCFLWLSWNGRYYVSKVGSVRKTRWSGHRPATYNVCCSGPCLLHIATHSQFLFLISCHIFQLIFWEWGNEGHRGEEEWKKVKRSGQKEGGEETTKRTKTSMRLRWCKHRKFVPTVHWAKAMTLMRLRY